MRYLILLMLICALSACMTQNKFNKSADNHKDWLAEKCVQHFPVKIGDVKRDTLYMPSTNIDYTGKIDSLKNLIDSLYEQGQREYAKAPENCKPALDKLNARIQNISKEVKYWKDMYEKCKPDTLIIDNEVQVLDSAAMYISAKTIKDQGEDIAVLTDKLGTRTKQRNSLAVVVLIVIVYFGIKIYKSVRPV